MKEFDGIWNSYLAGEPLSTQSKSKTVITESHHAESDDEEDTDINEEEYEYVYIDEDGNEIENYQESSEEPDKEGSEDPDFEAQKMATAEAKDKAKGIMESLDHVPVQELHENLRTLTNENRRLKEDLTFVIRKLRKAGLLGD